ncbi:MAG: glycoside hydrolase family 2 protein [Butyrivibrio sp.]|nr:glycoside hydrolase family 2 protein [Butyrivibrio sp.]
MDKKVINLNDNWKFHYGDCEPAWYKGFDDSDENEWKNVLIPHDWSVTMPFSKKCSSGTGYLEGGTGWYRLRFRLPKEYSGKNIRLCFDGVYKNSSVWCNSYFLGKRPGGYIPFSYDISDMVVFGEEENEVSVRVVRQELADSRWFTGNGITRKVYLVVQDEIHPKEHGIFFKTVDVASDKKSATISVMHKIEKPSEEKLKKYERRTLIVENRFLDMEGNLAYVLKDEFVLRKDESWKVLLKGTVKNPHLWSSDDPYLYKMQTWYLVEDSKEGYIFAGEEMVGIRKVVFDPDKGLSVNGESVKLKGVCVHHDGGCLGAAMKAEVWQRRLKKLKEAGCNAIRCSHNPHMEELYSLCDRMGFYMMDEAFDEWENTKNKWSTGHNVYPPRHQGYFEDFPMWHEADLKAMIGRDRNHPSVIMYSIGNEVDYPNDPYCHPMFDTMTGNNDSGKPEAERMYDKNKPNMERLSKIAAELTKIVKKADDSRPVTVAAAFPELSTKIGFIDGLDVVGYNYKEHLYEDDHKRFPKKTFLGSENGHGYKEWRTVTDNDYICGQFLWTGIDYLGEAHGWPVHGSTAGILSTAGLEKPDFSRRKTFWSDEPTVCIMTRRASDGDENWLPCSNAWDYEDGEEIYVKVYVTDSLLHEGNGIPGVQLFVNGDKKAEENSRTNDNAFEFRIPFEKGTLEAKTVNTKEKLSQKITTPSRENTQISCEVWKDFDIISGDDFETASRQKGYIYQIHVQAQDKDGNILRSAVSAKDFFVDRNADESLFMNEKTKNPKFMDKLPEIDVEVTGSGEFLGIDSGNLADTTAFTEKSRKLWNGEAVVYVRRTCDGEINLKISGNEINI